MGNLASLARKFLPVVLLSAVAACPPPKKGTTGTVVTVDGDPPDFPTDFDPGEPLPDPAAPDPAMYGLGYLQLVYPGLRDGWAAFLEDARLRLPPTDPLNQETLEVALEIAIGKDGAIAEITVASSSGNRDFDEVATEIAREAGRFPTPPGELLSDDDRVYLTWRFARDRRQAGIATAELRRVEWPLDKAVPKLVDDGNLGEAGRRLARAAERAGVDPKGAEATLLGDLTARLAVAAVRDGLRNEDPAVQKAAVDEVIGAAPTAGGALSPAARELSSIADGALEIDLRATAVTALGALRDTGSATMIATTLKTDQGSNAALSAAAAAALVALGQADAATTPLVEWLGSGDRARIGGALATLARTAVPGTTAGVARHLGHKDLGVRVAACTALGVAGRAGQDLATVWKGLKKGLGDRDATVRAACARGTAAAAARSKNRAMFYKMVKLFKDRDERVRAGAVLAAIRFEPEKVAQELTPIAKEKSAVVLAAYAEGLAVMKGEGGRPPKKLITLAGHGDPSVRAAAVASLARRGEGGEQASRELAASAIVDPEIAVRLAALPAIDDLEALGSLSSDPDADVAAAAQILRISRLGRWAALGEVAGGVATRDGVARVRLAGAWLRAS